MAERRVFAILVRTPQEKASARILIESIRAFGGGLRDCPVWIFETNPHGAPCHDLADNRVEIFSLTVPSALRDYPFADKVLACAQAEALASSTVQSLICVDPVYLFVHPPVLFDLGAEFDAAVRPVHVRNVGLGVAEPLDEYWQAIYASVGVRDAVLTVESFVDAQPLRAYFNTHAFAVNPQRGLLARWRDVFAALVDDADFQARACADERHRLFLFQAIFSALLGASLDAQRIRLLPPTYNYPYNLHAHVPGQRRARTLNDLVGVVYEGRTLDPGMLNDVVVAEPLRAWLAKRVAPID